MISQAITTSDQATAAAKDILKPITGEQPSMAMPNILKKDITEIEAKVKDVLKNRSGIARHTDAELSYLFSLQRDLQYSTCGRIYMRLLGARNKLAAVSGREVLLGNIEFAKDNA